jgi:hypothetical protein
MFNLLDSPKAKLVMAAVLAVVFAVGFFGVYLPLSKPAPTLTALGRVIGHTLQNARTVGMPGVGMKAGNQVRIGKHYSIDIRLDSGEVVRGSWPLPTVDALPIGSRVKVKLQRRVLLLFWKRTWVDDIEAISSGS